MFHALTKQSLQFSHFPTDEYLDIKFSVSNTCCIAFIVVSLIHYPPSCTITLPTKSSDSVGILNTTMPIKIGINFENNIVRNNVEFRLGYFSLPSDEQTGLSAFTALPVQWWLVVFIG